MTKEIKSYQITLYKYIFNVYNSSNYKAPLKISIFSPMLELATMAMKRKYPNHCIDFVEVA
jgi:exonuclease I